MHFADTMLHNDDDMKITKHLPLLRVGSEGMTNRAWGFIFSSPVAASLQTKTKRYHRGTFRAQNNESFHYFLSPAFPFFLSWR